MTVHRLLSNAILWLGLFGTLWAVENAIRRRVHPSLRVYLFLTFATTVVQGVIGLVLFITGDRPAEGLHWFYGPATLLSLPVAWSFAGRDDQRREAFALLGGALAVFLFSLRAIGTG